MLLRMHNTLKCLYLIRIPCISSCLLSDFSVTISGLEVLCESRLSLTWKCVRPQSLHLCCLIVYYLYCLWGSWLWLQIQHILQSGVTVKSQNCLPVIISQQCDQWNQEKEPCFKLLIIFAHHLQYFANGGWSVIHIVFLTFVPENYWSV